MLDYYNVLIQKWLVFIGNLLYYISQVSLPRSIPLKINSLQARNMVRVQIKQTSKASHVINQNNCNVSGINFVITKLIVLLPGSSGLHGKTVVQVFL